jgi:hypothetical protein
MMKMDVCLVKHGCERMGWDGIAYLRVMDIYSQVSVILAFRLVVDGVATRNIGTRR